MPVHTSTFGIAIALLAAFSAGCGNEPAQKPATQVAAKVNADEITVHQVNGVLARASTLSPEGAERAKREVLERLIDQQLAVQQAIDKKLDRSPAVQQALASARAEILARAYYEQIAAAQPKPSEADTKRYYAEHPELFAQRRLYVLEEIAVTLTPEQQRELPARAKSGLKETADWLKAQGVSFAPSRGVQAAEQIPMELLPRLQTAKDGEIIVMNAANVSRVIRVVATKVEPVDEPTAAPRIQQFLANRRASEAIANEMKQVRAGAKIEYSGEFAGTLAAAEEKAKADAAARARAEAEARAKTEADARAAQATKDRIAAESKARIEAEKRAQAAERTPPSLQQESIKKGLGGLK